jgi:hypothetical protein
MLFARVAIVCLALLVPAGCGGDDDEGEPPRSPAAAPSTETEAPPSVSEAEPDSPPEGAERRERTPKSLAECLSESPGVSEAIVKGRESEDATFFGDLAGGRVDVLGVTVEGAPAEVTVALFESEAAATKAEPSAAGGATDVEVERHGSALVVAPPSADVAAVHGCLGETGYVQD